MDCTGEAVQRLRLKADILGQVIVTARRRLARRLVQTAGRRLVERQPEARGQPFGRRQGIASLALVGAFGGQLQ